MPTVTALAIVNRIRRRMHMSDAADLTDRLSIVLLDLANEAKDYILETHNYDFDTRHDGILITRPVLDDTTTTVTTASTAFSGAGAFTPNASQDVAYILISSDATFGQTVHRIVSADAGSGVLDTAWRGAGAIGTATSKIMFPAYKLPDTVKDVLSVRYQEDELELASIGRDDPFNRVFPRWHDDISDNPRYVAVGSQVTTTYPTGVDTSQTGLGIMINPCPLSLYRLDYSYTVRHPALSASQGLENVPDYVVHDIVLEAEALAYNSSVANDPDLAERAHRRVELRSSRHYSVNTADPTRRAVLRSLDQKSSPKGYSRPDDEDVFYTP